jgi:hypothetical protein
MENLITFKVMTTRDHVHQCLHSRRLKKHIRKFSHLEIFQSKLFFQISCENCVGSAWNFNENFACAMLIFCGKSCLHKNYSAISANFVLHADAIPHFINLKANFRESSRPLPSFSITKELPLSITKKCYVGWWMSGKRSRWCGTGKSCSRKLRCISVFTAVRRGRNFFLLPRRFRLNSVVSYVAFVLMEGSWNSFPWKCIKHIKLHAKNAMKILLNAFLFSFLSLLLTIRFQLGSFFRCRCSELSPLGYFQ